MVDKNLYFYVFLLLNGMIVNGIVSVIVFLVNWIFCDEINEFKG